MATWPHDLAAATALLRDYTHFLLHNPVAPVEVCVGDFARELEALPQRYSGDHSGAVFLAWRGEEPVGCLIVRMLQGQTEAAELKRLFVKDESRGQGAGKALLHAGIDWAQQQNASEVLLDTVPAVMPQAVRLYESMGFCLSPPHNQKPLVGIVWYRLTLR